MNENHKVEVYSGLKRNHFLNAQSVFYFMLPVTDCIVGIKTKLYAIAMSTYSSQLRKMMCSLNLNSSSVTIS